MAASLAFALEVGLKIIVTYHEKVIKYFQVANEGIGVAKTFGTTRNSGRLEPECLLKASEGPFQDGKPWETLRAGVISRGA